MSSIIRPAIVVFGALSLLTGLLYPLAVTGVGKVAFPHEASGSLIQQNGKTVGSSLIGQAFSDPTHFWSRPSATGPMAYNAAVSSGSNQGPLNPALTDAVKGRIAALREADPGNAAPVPVDLMTASASGLDPHITVAAAQYQAARVARTTGLGADAVNQLIAEHTEHKLLGFFGEERVNVLQLNLALDALQKH